MSNLTIPVLIALAAITPSATAGETTIDLQGGGLFVVPARDPGDTSPRTFEYVVDASDTLRFINGTMIALRIRSDRTMLRPASDTSAFARMSSSIWA